MTAGKAIELCDQMRPNNDFADEMKQMWLRQCDARLRQTVVNRSACGDFDAVGADMARDGLEYDTQLLAPDAFSALYQHWAVRPDGPGPGRDGPSGERAADVQ